MKKWLSAWCQKLLVSSRDPALQPRPSFRPQLEALEDRLTPSAPPTTWDYRGVGGGGSLFSPTFNPQNTDELFISSDMGQVFHTTNLGASWTTLSFLELQGNHESSVQFTNGSNVRYTVDYTVVAGFDAMRPSKSTDGGLTWTPLAGDPTGGEVYYLRSDPNNANRVLLTNYNTLYFSDDGGAGFTQKFTTASGQGLLLGGVFWDGNNIYAGTNQGLLVSTNGGSSFIVSAAGGIPAGEAILSLAGAKEGGVTRLYAVTAAAGDVFAGVQGYDYPNSLGVYTLDIGQANWVARTTGLNLGTNEFLRVALAENDIDIAYVGGYNPSTSEPAIFKTANAGSSWQNIFLTANNQNIQTGWSGTGGDRGWGYGEIVFGLAVAANDANRVIFTDFGFAHISTDGGALWKAAYVQPADLNPAGSATPQKKAYHSSGLDNTSGWFLTWADASTIIGSNTDIRGQRSTDGGQTWSFNYTGHTLNSMYKAIKHSTTGVLYASTSSIHDMYQSTYLQDSRIDVSGSDGEVLFSTDQGLTWQVMHDFDNPVIWVAEDPTNPNRLYASVIHSTQGGIFVTNNANLGAASTWTKVTNPPRTEGHPFNIVVLNDGTLVVTYSGRRNAGGAFTTSSGVFVSTDQGNTWADRSDPGMLYWTKDIVVDPHDPTQNTWYVGVWSGWGGPPNGLGGLYKTTNRGQTWTRINSLDRVTSITISPTEPGDAYLTTETDGLWHTSNLNAATPTFTQVASYEFRQPERVFYNPFNPNEIWVTSFGGGFRVGTLSAGTAGQFQFSAGNYNVAENGATVTITVTRTGGSTGAVSVNYATSNGTATAGAAADYNAASGTLNFADGQTSQTFTIHDDALVEGNETIDLALSNPTGGATLGNPNTATVIITDDDVAQPGQFEFSAATYSVAEAGALATITVTRTGGSNVAASVTYATGNDTATAGSDYTAATNTLDFAVGETSKTFTVTILTDAVVEGDETVALTLSAPTNGATLGSQSTAVLTITDDDLATPPWRIDFTRSGAAIPNGFLADTGLVFGDRGGGLQFGWNRDVTALALDRNSPRSPDDAYDTSIRMRTKRVKATWEFALADGTYEVRVVLGDPKTRDARYRVNVEGQAVVRGRQKGAKRWVEGVVTVTVTDGRLTISNVAGPYYNKICFVVITPV